MPRGNMEYARSFNPYARGVDIEELQRVRRQLAKVMNRRMQRLEQAKSPVTGEAYTFGAYEKMSGYLQEHDRKRFSETLKANGMTAQELRREIRVLQGFEEMPSSTPGGMSRIESKRIKTLAEQGVSLKVAGSKSFYDFLNSKTFKEASQRFDSSDVRDAYARAADQGIPSSRIMKALDRYITQTKRSSLKGLKKALSPQTLKRRKG